MALNKEMVDLLKELTTNNNLTEAQQSVVLAQLEAIEKEDKQVKPQDVPKENKLLQAFERVFGKKAVTAKEGDIEIDLDNLEIGNDKISDAEKRVLELETKLQKIEQDKIAERINKMAFEAIKKEGYDPTKIASVINPADRLKIEGNKVVGLNDLMNTIRDAGFQKSHVDEPYDIMKGDWISDYKAQEEKSGLDNLMDDIFGTKKD